MFVLTAKPCKNGAVRLVDGLSPRNGRVEVCVNETWAPVCDKGITKEMASAICVKANFSGEGEECMEGGRGEGGREGGRWDRGEREGGIERGKLYLHDTAEMESYSSYSGAIIGSSGFFGMASGPATSRYTLSLDPNTRPKLCTDSNELIVFCREEVYTECATGDLRLAGSDSTTEGRLEVCLNNTWGTICDDSWHITASSVACGFMRQYGGDQVSAADYGEATDLPILLDDVKCTGSESNLLSCPQLPLGMSHDCIHQEDVALRCLGQCPSHIYTCTRTYLITIGTYMAK